MVVVKIEIKEHLKEYLLGRFNEGEDGPVRFPDKLDIYQLIYDLTEKRPIGFVDKGNVEIVLPQPHAGKKATSFNYLSLRSQRLIEKKIEVMMWAELHDLLDTSKHLYGLPYNETVYKFMKMYGIASLSEDAMIKNFYRYRENIRRRKVRRGYTKTCK